MHFGLLKPSFLQFQLISLCGKVSYQTVQQHKCTGAGRCAAGCGTQHSSVRLSVIQCSCQKSFLTHFKQWSRRKNKLHVWRVAGWYWLICWSLPENLKLTLFLKGWRLTGALSPFGMCGDDRGAKEVKRCSTARLQPSHTQSHLALRRIELDLLTAPLSRCRETALNVTGWRASMRPWS